MFNSKLVAKATIRKRAMNVKRDCTPIRLNSFLPYQITLLADRISRRTAAIARRHDGLNLSQWRVLAAIAEVPGRTANAVVEITPMDKGLVSRAVKSLIDMNLIVRKAAKQDGRLGHLFLTRKGARRYDAIAAKVRKLDDSLRSALSPSESALFSSLLARVLEAAGK